jgi:hypothetical protein
MSKSPPKIYKTIEISTVAEYLDKVKELEQLTYLFRGQGQDYDLSPSIARIQSKYDSIENAEREMLKDFTRRARPWLTGSLILPVNDFDWLALGQHHDMATRLLDWTENPLVALWFAVEKKFESLKIPLGSDCPVIWAFQIENDDIISQDIENLDPLKLTKTRVYRPSVISPRIIAQDGWFTVHAFIKSSTRRTLGFIPLQRNTLYRNRLTKFTVAKNAVGQLREELRRYGMHPASVFPSIEGLCRDITQRHSLRGDESAEAPLRLADPAGDKIKLVLRKKTTGS